MQTDTPQPEPAPPVLEQASAPVAESPAPAEPAAAEQRPESAPETASEPAPEPATEPASEPASEPAAPEASAPAPRGDRPPREPRPDRPPREARGERPPRERDRPGGGQPPPKSPNDRRGPAGGQDRPRDAGRGPIGGGDRRPDIRRPEGPVEIEYDKLIGDSLYLDNQAHVLVARLRDLDAGTRSQLRRLYGAVRRACRAPEADRQHQFVMLRARLAYTIARHGLRSLDPLEKLLLQVTRRNETRGYDRFRDLFEAIIAYNE